MREATTYIVKDTVIVVGRATTDRGSPILYGSVDAIKLNDDAGIGRTLRKVLAEYAVGVMHELAVGDKDLARKIFQASKLRSWKALHRNAHSVVVCETSEAIELQPLVRITDQYGGFGAGPQPTLVKLPIADVALGLAFKQASADCKEE